jgi:hypothetical protein
VALARAEDRSVSSLVVSLLDRGITLRAGERRLVREMVERLDAELVEVPPR